MTTGIKKKKGEKIQEYIRTSQMAYVKQIYVLKKLLLLPKIKQ